MITPVAPTSEVKMSGIEDSMDFCLDPAATAHILNMLRSGVYKDPKMACVREYWCNARDAAIEAGKDPSKAVTIYLPNHYEPNLRIKDEGVGLSETDFRRIFRKYGASTKRESNEQIGCLGIGSKSAFSYSDTFTVTAIKSGVKRVFIASVASNSTAKDGIGNLNKVLEIDTEEPNGIEVSIPIKEDDYDDFRQKVCHFLSFIPVDQRPIVKGIHQSLITIPERPSEFKDSNWNLTDEGRSYAIMGGVPYNIDVQTMNLLNKEEIALLNIGVDISFPIGSFEFAISREEVRATEISQNAIKAELQKIIAYLSDMISKNFAAAKNIWEVKHLYYTVYQNRSIEGKIIRECFDDAQKAFLTWNGQKVTNSTFSSGTGGVGIYDCDIAFDGRVDKTAIMSIEARKKGVPVFVIHDAKRYGEWQRMLSVLKKVKGDIEAENKRRQDEATANNSPVFETLDVPDCYLLRFESDAAKDAWFKEYDFGSLPILNLSAFPRDMQFSKATRQHSKTFTFDYKQTLNREDSWIADEPEMDKGGFYIEIKRGFYCDHPLSQYNVTNKTVQEVLTRLKALGHDIDVLWGFRTSVIDKLDHSKWTNVIKFFLKEEEQFLTNEKVFQPDEDESLYNNIVSGREDDTLNTSYNFDEYMEDIIPNVTKPDSLFVRYMKESETYRKKFRGDKPHAAIVQFFEKLGGSTLAMKQAKAGVSQEMQDFQKLAKEVYNKYPMLSLCYSWGRGNATKVTAYINEKDA